jgi:hypothetical protein
LRTSCHGKQNEVGASKLLLLHVKHTDCWKKYERAGYAMNTSLLDASMLENLPFLITIMIDSN